ncbi:MAG: putative aminomethyltransferase [Methanomassiliicoccales archaeon PtaU1.Bin124]|nr:MAG: putative aminomethyltransferase [Methanomassiliicoccales archaeon PtaU1.Bin124]
MLRTPLFEEHIAAGARMVEFAGWEMPIQYQGIIDEHLAVRSSAGLFDVSHMGDVLIKGKNAESLLLKLLTNDIRGLEIGKGIYAHILNEDGMIMDDTIVYRLGEEEYLLVPNASTTPKIVSWIQRHRTDQTITDISSQVACLALQGPKASAIGKWLNGEMSLIKRFHCRFLELPLASAQGMVWEGKALVARTGYTGEDGFEIMLDGRMAAQLWRLLLQTGKQNGLVPVGLGARDTLRLEMGYLLSGTDFDGSQCSVQTGPDFVVKWEHDFIGKEAMRKLASRPDLPRLACFELLEKGIPRHGYVLEKDGKPVGSVTSGTFSPSLHKGIGMGYLPPALTRPGTSLDVVIRGTRVKATVVLPPFLKR